MVPVIFWQCKCQWHNDTPEALIFPEKPWSHFLYWEMKGLKCAALLCFLWIATIFQEVWHWFFQGKRFLTCGCCCSHLEYTRHIKTCFPRRTKHDPRGWHNICRGKRNIRLHPGNISAFELRQWHWIYEGLLMCRICADVSCITWWLWKGFDRGDWPFWRAEEICFGFLFLHHHAVDLLLMY